MRGNWRNRTTYVAARVNRAPAAPDSRRTALAQLPFTSESCVALKAQGAQGNERLGTKLRTQISLAELKLRASGHTNELIPGQTTEVLTPTGPEELGEEHGIGQMSNMVEG